VKKYANLGAEMKKDFETYIKDVRTGAFPAEECTYRMIDGELTKLVAMRKKQNQKLRKKKTK
jgi:3-methyl-2-oxobutanoate hydroxymethyltransferase